MKHVNIKKLILVGVCLFVWFFTFIEINILGFDNNNQVSSITTAIMIEMLWILLAGGIIVVILLKLSNANRRINEQMKVFKSISDIYFSMHLIDLDSLKIERLESNELMDRVVSEGDLASDMLERIVKLTIADEYLEAALAFVDLSTIRERLKNKKSIFSDAINKNVGWLRMSFITVETDKDNIPTKVLIATQVIDENKRREEELSNRALIDQLTGLYNRRSYENDLLTYPAVPTEPDFVYVAIDINSLKDINDTIGHAAGDEIIKGTAECLKRTLGSYGKVYRTGGDEFVSMLFADEEHLVSVIKDLENMTNEWQGDLAKSLSVSIGYVTKREFPDETVANMAKIADQRMYLAKTEYYSQKGVDRRGQVAAHTALCNLYTKILKINLTTDACAIVNMDISEQTLEMGFADKISEWMYGFAMTGQVHPDDLEMYLEKTNINYLREYFKQDKTSMTVFYRRKYDSGYKQVVMEMIPADDYSDDNQSLFLYVKSLDK